MVRPGDEPQTINQVKGPLSPGNGFRCGTVPAAFTSGVRFAVGQHAARSYWNFDMSIPVPLIA